MLSAINASLMDAVAVSDVHVSEQNLRRHLIERQLQTHGFITNAVVPGLCTVSSATANLILSDLISDGRLVKVRYAGHWAYRKL